MKDVDILPIQEHWLFKFEEKEIEKLLPNIDFYARYIDEDSSINHTERIRGYGGILTIWNEDLTPLIRRLPEGKNNITAIELEAKPYPICLINCYMPCRGTTNIVQLY